MQNLPLKAEDRPVTKDKGFPLPVWAGQSSTGQLLKGGAQTSSIHRTSKEHSWKK